VLKEAPQCVAGAIDYAQTPIEAPLVRDGAYTKMAASRRVGWERKAPQSTSSSIACKRSLVEKPGGKTCDRFPIQPNSLVVPSTSVIFRVR